MSHGDSLPSSKLNRPRQGLGDQFARTTVDKPHSFVLTVGLSVTNQFLLRTIAVMGKPLLSFPLSTIITYYLLSIDHGYN